MRAARHRRRGGKIAMGTDRAVRKEAKTDLPVLRTHLELAKAALAAVGGSG
jgi:hypothetical protein